jgi:hypothetical protein
MKTRALKILAVSLGLCAAAGHLAAQVTLTNLYSFIYTGSISSNGYYPLAGLVQGSDGNFYGTTSSGGKGSGHSLVRFLSIIFLFFGFRVGSVRIHGVFFVPSCEPKIVSPQRHRGAEGNFFFASRRLRVSRQ